MTRWTERHWESWAAHRCRGALCPKANGALMLMRKERCLQLIVQCRGCGNCVNYLLIIPSLCSSRTVSWRWTSWLGSKVASLGVSLFALFQGLKHTRVITVMHCAGNQVASLNQHWSFYSLIGDMLVNKRSCWNTHSRSLQGSKQQNDSFSELRLCVLGKWQPPKFPERRTPN